MTTQTKAFAYKPYVSLLGLTFFRVFILWFYLFACYSVCIGDGWPCQRTVYLFAQQLSLRADITPADFVMIAVIHSQPFFFISRSNPSILNCLSPDILFYFLNDRLVLKIYRYINKVSSFHCSSQFLSPAAAFLR